MQRLHPRQDLRVDDAAVLDAVVQVRAVFLALRGFELVEQLPDRAIAVGVDADAVAVEVDHPHDVAQLGVGDRLHPVIVGRPFERLLEQTGPPADRTVDEALDPAQPQAVGSGAGADRELREQTVVLVVQQHVDAHRQRAALLRLLEEGDVRRTDQRVGDRGDPGGMKGIHRAAQPALTVFRGARRRDGLRALRRLGVGEVEDRLFEE